MLKFHQLLEEFINCSEDFTDCYNDFTNCYNDFMSFCNDCSNCSEDGNSDLYMPTLYSPLRPNVQQPRSSRTNPFKLSETNSMQFCRIPFNNARENVFRTLSESRHFLEEISPRTARLHSSPSRTRITVYSISANSEVNSVPLRTRSTVYSISPRTGSGVDVSLRPYVQQQRPLNPFELSETNSTKQFGTISLSNESEDVSRELAESRDSREISSRTSELHSNPPRTRHIDEFNPLTLQTPFIDIREDLFRTVSDSSYSNEETSSTTPGVYGELSRRSAVHRISPRIRSGVNSSSPRTRRGVNSSPPKTRSGEVTSSDRPPEYSVVVLSDLKKQVNFPLVKPVEKPDTPPPKYDENSFSKF